MRPQPGYDAVQQGVSLALDAHRRGFVGDRELDAILAYYDNEGAVDPFPPAEILTKIGGVTAEQLRELFGRGPARAPSEIQGQRFGDRLTLLEPIGEGGMGTVFRAYDRVLKRAVAVKRMRVDSMDAGASTRALARFEREAMALARVRHPACVQIFDAGLTKEGEPYLVMEFVAGKSLRAVIEEHHAPGGRGPIDPRQVATWGAAIAEALQACHDVGLVHRDVKPANVLLDAQRQPRLTDFGVALDDKARTKLTMDKAMVGTLAYMAPEQALGAATVDARSDVYALGATLYELLTGRPPFDAGSALILLRQVVSVEPTPLRKLAPRVPVDLQTVVMKCLNKAADDRYATAQALALDLRRFLADEPVLARPTSAGQRLARRVWRARRLVGVVGVLALGTIATAGLARVRAREAERARIDAALAAAAVASDIDAAEQEVMPLVAIAEPEQAERAREALRVLRGRRRLQEAEAAFERWKEATARAKALLDEADALRERIDPQQPYAESVDKKRLTELEEERDQTVEAAAGSVVEVERLLAQAAIDVQGHETDAARARVLLARAREVERDDPDRAERLFLAARVHDEASGRVLTAELADPKISVTSDPPGGDVLLERYAFDRDQGIMVPTEVARGRSPCTLQGVGSGSYRVSVQAPDYFVARDLLVLTRGEIRDVKFSLIRLDSVGPLASSLVHLPAGVARFGEGLRSRAATQDLLIQASEVSYEQWKSFLLSGGASQGVSSSYAPTDVDGSVRLDRAQRDRWPALNLSWNDGQAYARWLEDELAIADIAYSVRTPTLEEFARAVRGELPWNTPWGPRVDASFFTSSTGRTVHDLDVVEVLSSEKYIQDRSGFGVQNLAGRLAEHVARARERAVVGLFGGNFVVENWAIGRVLNDVMVQHPDARGLGAGVRLVLVPRRGIPLQRDREGARSEFQLALQRFRENDPRRAYEHATRALALDRTEAAYWVGRGNIRRMLTDAFGALWDYSQALQIAPGNGVALINRGLAQLERGDHAKALVDFDAAAESAPQIPDAWAGRALALFRLGRTQEARSSVERALELDPKSQPALEALRELEAR